MKILLRNKWFVFFIILILILLIIIGVFLWQKYKKPDVGYVLTEEFIITESNGEKTIEYKEGGFRMRIPGNWDTHDSSGVRLLFTSPDFQLYEKAGPYSPPIPEKGCVISIEIVKGASPGMEYSHVQELIEACPTIGQDCNEYKIIEIDRNKGLEYVHFLEDNFIPGRSVWIRVPKNEKIYNFESWFFSQDRERCEQEFENILNTVEIRK